MPLLGELSRSSQDSFELDSDLKESWDDWLNSYKNGISKICAFFLFEHRIDRIDQTYRAIKLLADGEQAEAINELMESKGAALGYRNLFNNIARSITKINKAREMIRRDPNMSSSEKKERLLALNKQRIELSRRAMKMAEDSGYFE